jgi:hypothetical protein
MNVFRAVGLLFIVVAPVCLSQSLEHYFGSDTRDQRSYFTVRDTTLTLRLAGDVKHPAWKYQLGEVTVKAYPRTPGRELSTPAVSKYPESKLNSAPSTTIDLRTSVSASTDMLVVSISVIYVQEGSAIKHRAKVGRRDLYREFIRSGK